MNIFLIVELVILLLLSCISDSRERKIKNRLVSIFIIIGLLTNYITGGEAFLRASLIGVCLPILLLFFLFVLSMLGAGDIKLLGAVGGIVGYPNIINIMILSFLSGGCMALILIIRRKNYKERIRHIIDYLRLCFNTHSIHKYEDFNRIEDGSKFRFSFSIALGTFLSVFINLI